jgi:hypothetical protein
MSNALLTVSQITREAQRILHQKLNFVGSINRQYDSSFAKAGAKIGDTLRVRLPNQYTVRTGANLSTQDTTEQSVSLTVATQKGVDTTFSSAELTLSLDDFSKRILDPAMSVLASTIEADAMSMYKDINKQVNNQGSANSFLKVAQAGKLLTDALTPYEGRALNMNTQDNLDVVQDLKGLFNAQDKLSSNYKDGRLAGPFAGFSDIYENTLWPAHTPGDAASYVCNTSTGITSGTATITVSGGSGTFKQGDVITIAGVFRVHPETKASTGQLQQFVVTADSTTSVAVYPTPVTSGALQNVTIVGAGSGKTVTSAGTASTAHGVSMAYHRDAFAFATADLVLPEGVDFAAREVFDGISLRIVRQYAIGTDTMPCRIDVLYGYKAIRPQLACRIANN